MEAKIFIHGDVKKFYPYRSASLKNITLSINNEEDRLSKIVSMYLKSQGYRMDNHICWESTTGVCFAYSDHKLHIGSSIEEGRW